MKFFLHHLLSWPFESPNSASLQASNRLVPPPLNTDKIAELYQEYLNTLTLAEEWGFDGISLGEHHQTTYSMSPSPMLFGAALSQRTRRIAIATMGLTCPLHRSPVGLAEELALLDQLSLGRLIVGFSLGQRHDYESLRIDPTQGWERLQEAIDLLRFAWTANEPISWTGKQYFYPEILLWPRPLQHPCPNLWIEALPVSEMIEHTARHKMGLQSLPFYGLDFHRQTFQQFESACQCNGYAPGSEQIGWTVPIYVSKTDDQARAEFEPHLRFFLEHHFTTKIANRMAPGLLSTASTLALMKQEQERMHPGMDWNEIITGAYAIVGSPATVRERIKECSQALGVGVLFGLLQIGSLPHMLTRKSMALIAREVLPYLRGNDPIPASNMETRFPWQSKVDTATIGH